MRVVFWLVVRAVSFWLCHRVFWGLFRLAGAASSYAWNQLPDDERDRINGNHQAREARKASA